MQALFLVLHVLVGIGLITLILLQHGKGADAGAAFGSGASATVFGARGSATFLTKATAVLALLFFSNSFFLNYLSANTTGPKSIIEEQKEDNSPTGIIESTVTPEPEPPAEPPQSDLPALPGGSGRGVTGSDVPPAPVSPSPGSQGSDSPLPEAPAPESPAGESPAESRSAAPNIQAPAADTPKDAPAGGEGEAGATPKPVEGVESKSAQPAESGPTAGPKAEPSAEPTPEAASPTEPPSTAAGKEPSAAAKPPATAPKVPAKKTQTATDKPATKRTPEPKTSKQQPSTGKSTSSTDKKTENKTP